MGVVNANHSQGNHSIGINLTLFLLLLCGPWGFLLLSCELTYDLKIYSLCLSFLSALPLFKLFIFNFLIGKHLEKEPLYFS